MTYTTAEVAEVLKLSPDTVRGLIVSGRLQALNLAEPGKRAQYRVTAEQLAEYQQRTTIAKFPIRRKKKPRLAAGRWYP